eukprot:36210-Eustigmatos_ZCMA.PRE.1
MMWPTARPARMYTNSTKRRKWHFSLSAQVAYYTFGSVAAHLQRVGKTASRAFRTSPLREHPVTTKCPL